MNNLAFILRAIFLKKVNFTSHGYKALDDDDIEILLQSIIDNGEIIENYPTDYPLPSCLVLSWVKKPLHNSVWAIHESKGEIRCITGYVPHPDIWSEDFKKRKPK